jgi:hypothetical protein
MDPLHLLSLVVSMGLFIIGLGGLYLNTSTKFLSIREHETYNSFVVRELNTLSKRIDMLEQTRPTTGELKAVIKGHLGGSRQTQENCE